MSLEAWIRAQRLALLEHAAASLRKNRIEAEVVSNAQRLLERLEQLVPQTASASSGGSVTLEQTGVLNWLRTSGRSYYAGDPHAPDCGTREQIQFCDYYFMSANAITLNGELYNVDGSGNRVSALAYGPAHVVVIAGANKIVRDLAAAEQRVKLLVRRSHRGCIPLQSDSPSPSLSKTEAMVFFSFCGIIIALLP